MLLEMGAAVDARTRELPEDMHQEAPRRTAPLEHIPSEN